MPGTLPRGQSLVSRAPLFTGDRAVTSYVNIQEETTHINMKIEINDLSKKLGISKKMIKRLCRAPGSTMRYEKEDGKKWLEYNEVVATIQRGIAWQTHKQKTDIQK